MSLLSIRQEFDGSINIFPIPSWSWLKGPAPTSIKIMTCDGMINNARKLTDITIFWHSLIFFEFLQEGQMKSPDMKPIPVFHISDHPNQVPTTHPGYHRVLFHKHLLFSPPIVRGQGDILLVLQYLWLKWFRAYFILCVLSFGNDMYLCGYDMYLWTEQSNIRFWLYIVSFDMDSTLCWFVLLLFNRFNTT